MALKKRLGLIHVFAIASGAMISSGLFVLPGLAHAMAGPGMVVSYLIAGLLATAGALSVAELTTAMPRAGGDYFFISRGMGAGAGTIAGVLSWFSLSLKSAFAIVGMATFLRLIVSIHGMLAGAGLCVVFVGINLLGVREAARTQVLLVAGLLGLLGVYVVVGLPRVHGELLLPFAPHGLEKLFTTAGFVYVSYGGLLKIASVAEEVRDPGRNIPRGMVLSLVAVTLIYTLVVFVTGGVLPTDELDHSLTPISDGARAVMGQGGYVALSIGAILAFVSTANAGIMAASRYLLALSRDRLLPEPLARINQRSHTPHVAIGITGAVILLSLLLDLRILVEAASTVLIVTGVLACLSVIVLRESGLQNYRPAFRAPLYPWLQIGGIVGLGLVLFEMGVEAYVISAILVLTAFLAYWLYGRKRVKQDFALMHLVARLTARELVNGSLESELKDIVRERDEIVLDRFDDLIERCPVLDLAEHVGADEFFQLAADRLADRVGASPKAVAAGLHQREAQASSLLTPWLAIPHLVVEGEGRFDVLLARARRGIAFSDQAPNVQAAFVLVGSRDERNFHLRALAAIAQIVQGPDFRKRWLSAKGDQALRDAVLLGTRQRQ